MSILGYATLREAAERFDWDCRWTLFEGNRQRFNLADECLDRPLRHGRGAEIGLRIVYADGRKTAHTFAELAAASAAAARMLEGHGVGRGDPVAVRLEPGFEFVATMFGVLRLGAVFVPCSPLLGRDAILARIQDARPRVVVLETQEDLAVAAVDSKVVSAREIRTALNEPERPYPAASTVPEDPAIFIYSSGTTGRPKRTAIQHQGFTFLAVIIGKFVLDLQPSDRYLSCYTPGYLGGFGWGILLPLALGAPAGIYAGRFDPKVFLGALVDWKITALHCPPTVYRRLLKVYRNEPLALRKLAYTAEGLDAHLAREIKEKFGSYARGHYGATEVGMVAIDYAFPDYQVRPGALGKPLLGTEVVIVDADRKPVPDGTLGEIAVLRRGRLLLPGDFGVRDQDGYLWYRGRANDVIITAGHTLGAVEIEEVLRKHPAVAEAAVVAKKDPDRGHIAKAFVQLNPGAAPATDEQRAALVSEIQDFVRERLGRHAYPREISFVADFARNEAGKISKLALSDS